VDDVMRVVPGLVNDRCCRAGKFGQAGVKFMQRLGAGSDPAWRYHLGRLSKRVNAEPR
jgi:hypothetical protein